MRPRWPTLSNRRSGRQQPPTPTPDPELAAKAAAEYDSTDEIFLRFTLQGGKPSQIAMRTSVFAGLSAALATMPSGYGIREPDFGAAGMHGPWTVHVPVATATMFTAYYSSLSMSVAVKDQNERITISLKPDMLKQLPANEMGVILARRRPALHH